MLLLSHHTVKILSFKFNRDMNISVASSLMFTVVPSVCGSKES